MIERWMLSVIVLGAVIAVGGTFLGHITARSGLPRRWMWLALMVMSIALPIALATRTAEPAAQPASPTRAPRNASRQEPLASAPTAPLRDRALLIGWAALSLGLAALFTITHRRTLTLLGRWETRQVLGHRVAVSPDFGPAAVGLVRSRVVLPEWVLELPPAEQRLVLLHEQQHIDAGDQFVLLAGVLMIVLMPWNPGLWWQLRRLRVALELDCDARVAPTLLDRPHYAELLLMARNRRQAHRLVLAMAPAPSALTERLLALLDLSPPSRARVTAWSLSAVACAVLLTRIPVPELASLLAPPAEAARAPVTTASALLANVPAPDSVATQTRRGMPVGGHHVTAPSGSDTTGRVNSRPRYDILIPYVQGPPGVARGGGRAGFVGSTGAVRATATAALLLTTPPDSTQHLQR